LASADALVLDTVERFLAVESQFAGSLLDDVVRSLISTHQVDKKSNGQSNGQSNGLQAVIDLNLAHGQLATRTKLLLAMLRQLDTFPGRFDEGRGSAPLGVDLLGALEELSRLALTSTGEKYGEVALSAKNILREALVPPFATRLEDLREDLRNAFVEDGDENENKLSLSALSSSATLSAGVDLLSALFSDPDQLVRKAAVEVYVRRVYRAHRIVSLSVEEKEKNNRPFLTCDWNFQFADTERGESPTRVGRMVVVRDIAEASASFEAILSDFGAEVAKVEGSNAKLGDDSQRGRTINTLHLAVIDEPSCAGRNYNQVAEKYATLFKSHSPLLTSLHLRTLNVIIPAKKRNPKYFSFPSKGGWAEDELRRNMRPTHFHLFELQRLNENHDLERLSAISKNSQVYLGTERPGDKNNNKKKPKPARGPPPQVVFVRALSHSVDITSEEGVGRAMLQGLDELEGAAADPRVRETRSSRIFLHSLPELDITEEEVVGRFQGIVEGIKAKYAPRLLKLNVDEIEVKLRLKGTEPGSVKVRTHTIYTLKNEQLQAKLQQKKQNTNTNPHTPTLHYTTIQY